MILYLILLSPEMPGDERFVIGQSCDPNIHHCKNSDEVLRDANVDDGQTTVLPRGLSVALHVKPSDIYFIHNNKNSLALPAVYYTGLHFKRTLPSALD
jgi:hypothetical protein